VGGLRGRVACWADYCGLQQQHCTHDVVRCALHVALLLRASPAGPTTSPPAAFRSRRCRRPSLGSLPACGTTRFAAGAHGVRPPARERMPHRFARGLCGEPLRRRRRTATARRAPASRASRATAGFTMRPGMMTSPRTCAFATNPVKGFDRKTCSDPCMPWAAACACAGAQPRAHRSAQRATRRARGRASQVRTVCYSTLY
jgi:hypothetical protein